MNLESSRRPHDKPARWDLPTKVDSTSEQFGRDVKGKLQRGVPGGCSLSNSYSIAAAPGATNTEVFPAH